MIRRWRAWRLRRLERKVELWRYLVVRCGDTRAHVYERHRDRLYRIRGW